MMYKIRPYVKQNILKTLYYSLIYSHLCYGIEVWGNADKIHINRVFTLQKRAVRVILHKDQRQQDFSLPASNPLFIELKFLKIHNIFKLKITDFIFKCVSDWHPSNFHSWFKFTSDIHSYNTRSNSTNKLFIPAIRTTHYGLKSIKYNGPKTWNAIPITITGKVEYNKFIKNLKEYLITLP